MVGASFGVCVLAVQKQTESGNVRAVGNGRGMMVTAAANRSAVGNGWAVGSCRWLRDNACFIMAAEVRTSVEVQTSEIALYRKGRIRKCKSRSPYISHSTIRVSAMMPPPAFIASPGAGACPHLWGEMSALLITSIHTVICEHN